MCVVRLFPWWKFTDVCEGDIRKPCYSKWVRGQAGLGATASAHAPDRVPFEVRHRWGGWRRDRGWAPGFAKALSLASRCPGGRPAPPRGWRRRSPRRNEPKKKPAPGSRKSGNKAKKCGRKGYIFRQKSANKRGKGEQRGNRLKWQETREDLL